MVTVATATDSQKFTRGILRAIEVTWSGGTPEEAEEAPFHAGLQPHNSDSVPVLKNSTPGVIQLRKAVR